MKTFKEWEEERLTSKPLSYELTGVENSAKARRKFEELKNQVNVIGGFLKDIDTGGRYELIRYYIEPQVIQMIKEKQQIASNLISKMRAAAYAPRS